MVGPPPMFFFGLERFVLHSRTIALFPIVLGLQRPLFFSSGIGSFYIVAVLDRKVGTLFFSADFASPVLFVQ